MSKTPIAEIISASATAVAAVASAIIAIFALMVSRQTEDRLNQQETQQNASRVYVGEASKYAYAYAYKNRLSGPHEVLSVIMNASGAQVDNVWVEGENDTSVVIGSVQRYSLYALPHGFKPVAVDFTDSYGQWRRAVGSGPERNGFNSPPGQDTGDSPWWLDVQGCS
jgi:hypothetical protein